MRARRTSSALLAGASLMLSACSGEANPFAGKSPEQVATYLAFGLEDGAVYQAPAPRNLTYTTKTISTEPLVTVLMVQEDGQELEGFRVVTEYAEDCIAAFQINPNGEPQQLYPTSTLLLGLRNVSKAEFKRNEGFRLKGASRCVPSERDQCNTMERDWEFGWLKPLDTEEVVKAEQVRVDAAIEYFRTKICPQ